MDAAGLLVIGQRAALNADGVPNTAVSRAPLPQPHALVWDLHLGSDVVQLLAVDGLLPVGVVARMSVVRAFENVVSRAETPLDQSQRAGAAEFGQPVPLRAVTLLLVRGKYLIGLRVVLWASVALAAQRCARRSALLATHRIASDPHNL
jgi:hypothetical protein